MSVVTIEMHQSCLLSVAGETRVDYLSLSDPVIVCSFIIALSNADLPINAPPT